MIQRYSAIIPSSSVVSGLFIRPGRVGGAEFMTYSLVEGLLAAGLEVTFTLPEGQPVDSALLARTESARSAGHLRIRSVSIRGNRFLSEALDLPSIARSTGSTALFLPNYFTPPVRFGIPTLTSILDQQYLHYPQFFSPVKRAWLRATHAHTLRAATAVSVISNFVRDDLLATHGSQFERKVTTIPIGISWDRFAEPSAPQTVASRERPFILSVASHYSHKNLETLLRAFAILAPSIPHDLVLVGQRRSQLVGVRDGGADDLEVLAHRLGIADRVAVTGHVTDAEVGWCYRNAAAFVFPSLFEGFGMPVVEALGSGLPVITTRCGSLPEVTHGLAHLVDDPTDAEELAEALRVRTAQPDAYRPRPEDVQFLHDYYAPARIARLYLDALGIR